MKYSLENCTSNLCDYEMVVGLDYSSVDVFKADYSESAVVGSRVRMTLECETGCHIL